MDKKNLIAIQEPVYHFSCHQPPWLERELSAHKMAVKSAESVMELLISFARRNVLENSGGPFAAAVFAPQLNKIISAGVNSVTRSFLSIAHAEIVAISLAQTRLELFDLSLFPSPLVLVTTAQPCSQCSHAIWWSGLHKLVIGARTNDVEHLTSFREGPVPHDLPNFLSSRGGDTQTISIQWDCLRKEACEVLDLYTNKGGTIYGPQKPTGGGD